MKKFYCAAAVSAILALTLCGCTDQESSSNNLSSGSLSLNGSSDNLSSNGSSDSLSSNGSSDNLSSNGSSGGSSSGESSSNGMQSALTSDNSSSGGREISGNSVGTDSTDAPEDLPAGNGTGPVGLPSESELDPLAGLEHDGIEAGDSMTISSGEEFHVEYGKAYSIAGNVVVEDGGRLVVDNGGRLYISGTGSVDSEGDIVVSNGGGLEMLHDDAYIGGGGNLVVEGRFDDLDCSAGTMALRIVPPEPITENGLTTVGGVLIANKKISLPEDYGYGLTDETLNALEEMRNDSGYGMGIVSGFRDYASQERNFNYWVEVYGYDEALRISSPPGHSEHQTGLTMDITSLEVDYADTSEGIWLAENCHKYGFIIRYPDGKEDITGYSYEPWHVRYLGKSTAKLVHDSGLTLEEFLGVEGV